MPIVGKWSHQYASQVKKQIKCWEFITSWSLNFKLLSVYCSFSTLPLNLLPIDSIRKEKTSHEDFLQTS